ncbi:MAG: hypothetical protein JW827_12445 [Spirochaetes bacterium]|nr:hypothetical protein [Spirochaetota bacterium]
MKKISSAQKIEFAERTKDIKERIDELNKNTQTLLKDIAKAGPLANYKRLSLTNIYLTLIAMHIRLSDISLEILGIKNESYLETSRKLSYKVLQTLEEIVGTYVDAPLTDNKEQLNSITHIDDLKRFKIIQKVAEAITIVEEKFGPNSKWKWSFVDMEARAAAVCKNLTDFKRIQEKNDPRIEGFAERMDLLRFIKSYLRKASDRLREKYEIATHDFGEMKKAIQYLQALYRISNIFSTGSGEVENLKKNIKIWEEKLEGDEKKEEEKKKKKARGR